MIKNQRQLTEAQRKLADATAAATTAEGLDSDVYTRFARDIDEEIREYESIRDGYSQVFQITSVDDLAEALIKARISRGWTQQQLADACAVSEQMVQRDEAGGYEKAVLYRIADVVDALGYELQGSIRPHAEGSIRWLGTSLNGGFAVPTLVNESSEDSVSNIILSSNLSVSS
jgi:transcriptional regulator with XRE-family HTH domain